MTDETKPNFLGAFVDDNGEAWRISVQDDMLNVEHWSSTDHMTARYDRILKIPLSSFREIYHSDTIRQPD